MSPRSAGNRKAGNRPALIVVDMQRDFLPGGALAVKDGDSIIGPVNELISAFDHQKLPVVFTRDWHPADHISFASRGGPWPAHSVKNSQGAEFHQSLHIPRGSIIISKATTRDREAYSGFQGTTLAKRLRDRGVTELYIAGLATDYCVKNTVIDGIAEGFKVDVVEDAIKGVNVSRRDSADALRAMVKSGAGKAASSEVVRSVRGRAAVSSSS